MKMRICLFALSLIGSCVFAETEKHEPGFSLAEYFRKGKGSPAEFVTNNVAAGPVLKDVEIIRGTRAGNLSEARARVKQFIQSAKAGFAWKCRIPVVSLPRYSNRGMDGMFTFSGEYELNSTNRMDSGAIWRCAWDCDYFYAAVQFPDNDIVCDSRMPFNGDCLELFIRSDERSREYREVLLTPDGTLQTWIHQNNPWASFVNNVDETPVSPFPFALSGNKTQYSLELRIPWKELPGYFKGNAPKPGEVVYFMMVRTRRDGTIQKPSTSPVPLLYNGHNIFGYIKAILQ